MDLTSLRRDEHMSDEVMMTDEEQLAMMRAMKNTYGPCTCRTVVGGLTAMCEGHRFLAQTYGPKDIPQMALLLGIRRDLRWVNAEHDTGCWPREPAPMPERTNPFQALIDALDAQSEANTQDPPREGGTDPNVLPW